VGPATATDAAAEAAPAPTTNAPASASLSEIVRDSAEYARALGQLVASEAALAKVSLARIFVVALLVPAIAIGVVLGLDALLVALLFRWTSNWSIAIAIVAAANIALLLLALWLLRSWWHTLSLPRSRAALASLWERP
jgi:hypothetical protein